MKKIICFDLNGTLVEENSWDILTRGRKDIEEEISGIFKKYYSKEISVDDLWKALTETLKKTGIARKDFICESWDNSTKFKEGAEDILAYLKEKGYRIYIISCSVDIYLECIVTKFGLAGHYAGSRLAFDDSGELVAIESDCTKHGHFKMEMLQDLSKKEEVDIEEIIFVGDGDNDIDAFKATKHGIAMDTDNGELLDHSWKQIKKLSEIKEIL